jgi:phosphomevalonate kinase
MKYEPIKYLKSTAPIVITNSVITKVPSNGATSSASLIISLTSSYSAKISKAINISKNSVMLLAKIFV